MPSKPFKSNNEEINKIIEWALRTFQPQELQNQIQQREFKNIGNIPERDMQERELRIRDNQGKIQLVTNWKGILKTLEFDKSMAQDYFIEVAKGNIPGTSSVNVIGLSPSGIQTTITDIWDRADATPTQQVWVAPTQARVHAIVSSSTDDDGSPAGVGARTIRVYGLSSWSSDEITEDITLNGTTPVNTSNSYVIIHKMEVLTKGATSVNVGTITATAATDSTVTAQINPGYGKTLMAIYGIPTGKTAYITQYFGNIHNHATPGTAYVADLYLKINKEPDTQLTNFINFEHIGITSDGSNFTRRLANSPIVVAGPAIIKLSMIGSAADGDCSGGIDLILI